jgi:endoribonuclease Nob1
MSAHPKKQCKQIIVLDTSAFVAGFDPFALSEEQITVPAVEEEIKRNAIICTRFKTAVESGKITVKTPRQEFLTSAKAFASKLGDSYLLSKTDTQLLALALELKAEDFSPQIVTDDYSIQNVATQAGIEFLPLATFGIKRLLEWIRYCPACYREYPANCSTKECQVCGTELKRKPRRTVKSVKAR